MRIAIDCRYVRERPSGIGAYVEELVDRLPALAPDATFNFWAHRLARRPLSDSPNVVETRVAPEPNALRTVLWPQRYASFDGIDVFHGPHNILPRNIRCPSVVTIHDILPLEHRKLAFVRWRQRAKRIYYVGALRRALRDATRLIVTTGVMADRLIGLFPETARRIDVVSMGVADTFRPAADRVQATKAAADVLGCEDPFLLVVGQDAPNKRHDIALAAFAEYVPEPWRLVLVQRQTRYPRLFREADRLGVAHRVSWFPHLALEDLVKLYRAAEALVQPSSYEGFGLPVLEAMACGCPVIATDLDVFREVIGSAGLLVASDDFSGLGRAMRGLLQERSQAHDLRHAGLEQARKFSWDRCARETLEVIGRGAGATIPSSLGLLDLRPVAA